MVRGCSDGQQQKYTQHEIDSKHHLIAVVGLLVLRDGGEQRIDAGYEEEAGQD
jgi:hypothetical protein